jgi:hypothetical protein
MENNGYTSDQSLTIQVNGKQQPHRNKPCSSKVDFEMLQKNFRSGAKNVEISFRFILYETSFHLPKIQCTTLSGLFPYLSSPYHRLPSHLSLIQTLSCAKAIKQIPGPISSLYMHLLKSKNPST